MNAPFRPPRPEGPDPFRKSLEFLIAYYEDVVKRTERSIRLMKIWMIYNLLLLALILYLQIGPFIRLYEAIR